MDKATKYALQLRVIAQETILMSIDIPSESKNYAYLFNN